MAKSSRKSVKKYFSKVNLQAVLSVVVTILIVAVVALFFMVTQLQSQAVVNHLATTRALILDASRNLFRPVPEAPKDGQFYLPEANLRFPIGSSHPNISYRYLPAFETEPESIVITSRSTASSASSVVQTSNGAESTEAIFKNFSEYQKCAVAGEFVITIGWKSTNDVMKLISSPLLNGKQYFIYQNSTCTQWQDQTEATILSSSLQNIQSY